MPSRLICNRVKWQCFLSCWTWCFERLIQVHNDKLSWWATWLISLRNGILRLFLIRRRYDNLSVSVPSLIYFVYDKMTSKQVCSGQGRKPPGVGAQRNLRRKVQHACARLGCYDSSKSKNATLWQLVRWWCLFEPKSASQEHWHVVGWLVRSRSHLALQAAQRNQPHRPANSAPTTSIALTTIALSGNLIRPFCWHSGLQDVWCLGK